MFRPTLARSLRLRSSAAALPCRCASARPDAHLARAAAVVCTARRAPFSTTAACLKGKKDKGASKAAAGDDDSAAGGAAGPAAPDLEALFAKLDDDHAKVLERLRDELAKLRLGRADPAVLEALKVVVDKDAGGTVPLRDVAHVVPKGRALAVTVYEAENVKKVISAIQMANLNMQPVVDAKNAQVVNVPLPPPTKESRDAMGVAATKTGQKAQDGVRNARMACHKKLQAAKKSMRPDDLKKGEKRMEEIVKKHKTEVDKVVEQARKSIMEG